jgi:hypothetical protein
MKSLPSKRAKFLLVTVVVYNERNLWLLVAHDDLALALVDENVDVVVIVAIASNSCRDFLNRLFDFDFPISGSFTNRTVNGVNVNAGQ